MPILWRSDGHVTLEGTLETMRLAEIEVLQKEITRVAELNLTLLTALDAAQSVIDLLRRQIGKDI